MHEAQQVVQFPLLHVLREARHEDRPYLVRVAVSWLGCIRCVGRCWRIRCRLSVACDRIIATLR